MTTTKTTYHLWAEHTGGASISHPCTAGVWSDPTDSWSPTVEAETEDEARQIGERMLRELCDEYEPCKCHRRLSPGWDSWWNSVCVTASRTPYPRYTGDEE